MTVLEAHVSKDNWDALKQAYTEAIQHQDPGLVQTFLVQNMRNDDIWRIITLWSSREALDEMRRSGETPRGVLIFRSANAEPELSIFDVVQKL